MAVRRVAAAEHPFRCGFRGDDVTREVDGSLGYGNQDGRWRKKRSDAGKKRS